MTSTRTKDYEGGTRDGPWTAGKGAASYSEWAFIGYCAPHIDHDAGAQSTNVSGYCSVRMMQEGVKCLKRTEASGSSTEELDVRVDLGIMTTQLPWHSEGGVFLRCWLNDQCLRV
jgi:hypothetical protein